MNDNQFPPRVTIHHCLKGCESCKHLYMTPHERRAHEKKVEEIKKKQAESDAESEAKRQDELKKYEAESIPLIAEERARIAKFYADSQLDKYNNYIKFVSTCNSLKKSLNMNEISDGKGNYIMSQTDETTDETTDKSHCDDLIIVRKTEM